jgi:hypothetical protein
MRPLEPQLLRPAEQLAFCGRLGKQDIELSRRVGQQARSPIGDSHHQRRFPFMHCHDGVSGEDQLGPRREKRTKVRPVRIAVKASPQTISLAATTRPYAVAGYISP